MSLNLNMKVTPWLLRGVQKIYVCICHINMVEFNGEPFIDDRESARAFFRELPLKFNVYLCTNLAGFVLLLWISATKSTANGSFPTLRLQDITS